MAKLFNDNIQMLGKALDLRARRGALLNSNVANIETPGYKARDIVFEKALKEAMESKLPGPLQVTEPRHMDGRRHLPIADVNPTLIYSASPDASLDGNTVDLEQEMAKIAENQINYQALTQMISDKFSKLKLAISK